MVTEPSLDMPMHVWCWSWSSWRKPDPSGPPNFLSDFKGRHWVSGSISNLGIIRELDTTKGLLIKEAKTTQKSFVTSGWYRWYNRKIYSIFPFRFWWCSFFTEAWWFRTCWIPCQPWYLQSFFWSHSECFGASRNGQHWGCWWWVGGWYSGEGTHSFHGYRDPAAGGDEMVWA